MKALIVYFSGTGNNLYVARSLGKQLGEGTILPIRRLMEVSYQKKLKDYTHIVFCVPSYHSHIPRYVAEVMEKIQFNKEQKIYSIVVCGGNRGHAVEDMRAVIQKAGGKVSGEYFIILPGNYILSYGAMPNLVIGAECQMADRKVKRLLEILPRISIIFISIPVSFIGKVMSLDCKKPSQTIQKLAVSLA